MTDDQLFMLDQRMIVILGKSNRQLLILKSIFIFEVLDQWSHMTLPIWPLIHFLAPFHSSQLVIYLSQIVLFPRIWSSNTVLAPLSSNSQSSEISLRLQYLAYDRKVYQKVVQLSSIDIARLHLNFMSITVYLKEQFKRELGLKRAFTRMM